MANRTIKVLNSVAATSTVTQDSLAIPVGKRIRFKRLIVGDQNTSNNVSSLVLVQWGTVGSFEEIAAAAMTGNTVQLDIDEERVADGVKFIRITRQNNGSTVKRIMAWLVMFDS